MDDGTRKTLILVAGLSGVLLERLEQADGLASPALLADLSDLIEAAEAKLAPEPSPAAAKAHHLNLLSAQSKSG
jgi:hypothetical protein